MKASRPGSMPKRSSSAGSSDFLRRGSISETACPPDVEVGGVAVAQLVRRSRWPVLRRLGFHPGGDERSSLRGAGLEYSDVREYQAGDDPRTIEWNITARSDRPYVRESLPDPGLDAWLLVDITCSLTWGPARSLKRTPADRPRQPRRRTALRRPRPLDHPTVGGSHRPAATPRAAGACGRQSTISLPIRGRAGWEPNRPRPGADRGRPAHPTPVDD